jgi:asparagine synthetase B (glutamine-hydrolysing)
MYGYLARRPDSPPEQAAQRLKAMLSAAELTASAPLATFADDAFAIAVLGEAQLGEPAGDEGVPSPSAFFDGYLLNRKELSDSLKNSSPLSPEATDARLMEVAYGIHGEGVTDLVHGVFNFCAYSRPARQIRLINCRHGVRHLYYFLTDRCFAFSTELKALAATGDCPIEVDRLSISDMFNFGYIGGGRTFFQDVKLLPQASVFTVSAEAAQQRTYWDYQYRNTGPISSRDELVDEVADTVRNAVGRCASRFGNIGVPLSGGLDSRTILACMTAGRHQAKVYHCSWYEKEEQIARQLCELAGSPWRALDPRDFDFASLTDEGFRLSDGNIQAHQFWLLPLARQAAEEVDVLLDGYLMDVYLGDTFLVLPEDGKQAPIDAINRLWRRCRPHFLRKTFVPEFYREYQEDNLRSIELGLAEIEEENLSNVIHRFSFANRSNRYSVAPPNVNRRYVEYAYPGLDPQVVDLYLRIPPAEKIGAGLYRQAVERHFPKFAQVPWAKTGKSLGKGKGALDLVTERLPLRYLATMSLLRLSRGSLDLSYRGDLNRLFRRGGSLRTAYLSVLDDPRTFDRGIIDRRGYGELVRFVDKGWPVFSLLESLITVELWFRRFIDD